MTVPMVQRIPQMGIVIFKTIGKSICQTIHPPWIDHCVIRSIKPVPFEGTGILTIFIKLSIQPGKNEQKQDDDHPAFDKLVVY